MANCELCHHEVDPERPDWQKLCGVVRQTGNSYKIGGDAKDGQSYGGYWSLEAWQNFIIRVDELAPSCLCGESVRQFFAAQTDYMIENGFLKTEDNKNKNKENKAAE